MAKLSNATSRRNVGKGKITPIQIAFIVDRYLADSNYPKTLDAFRSEAADLFSKTKGKEVPKGLLGLGDILDEYVSLKEQKIMVDLEKQRLEAAMRGLQDVMRCFFSSGSTSVPPTPPVLPPPEAVDSATPLFHKQIAKDGSPPGQIIQGASSMNCTQQSIPALKPADPSNFTTPVSITSSLKRKKASKSTPGLPLTAKRTRNQLHEPVSSVHAHPNDFNNDKDKASCVPLRLFHHTKAHSSSQGTSVAKSLFKQSSKPRVASCSPKTPIQELHAEGDRYVSPVTGSPLKTADIRTADYLASTGHAIISSETIIVSPLKNREGFYSVERTHHVTTSPLMNSKKLRDHVRGRLDFDESDMPSSLDKGHNSTDSSSSSANVEMQDDFDFNLPDLEIFNGDMSFSQFLIDIGIDCNDAPSSSLMALDTIPSECLESNGVFSASYLPGVNEALHENLEVASVKTVRNCIIVSPAKSARD